MCQNYNNKSIEIGEVRYSLERHRQVTVEYVRGKLVYLRETKTGRFFKRVSVILFQDYRLYCY